MTPATPGATPKATPRLTTPRVATGAGGWATTQATQATQATTRGLSGTARDQIEFSLNLLRIASPREQAFMPQRGTGAARIRALEELLGRVASHDATER